MWTLAHAHGGMLGILCLVHGCLAPRLLSVRDGARVAAPLRWAAVLMPLGFFAGGVLDHEGDPSLGILLVPCGGILLLVALLRAGFASAKVAAS
jgi:hypothetical protein